MRAVVLACVAACSYPALPQLAGGGDAGRDAAIDTPPGTARIGGTVTGLMGAHLVIQDNGGDDKPITADGAFSFATAIANGGAYAVTVKTQPSNPTQLCSVANGSGVVTAGDVTNVAITCTTSSFTIGGTVVGLPNGNSLVLVNSSNNDTVGTSTNGPFTFPMTVASGKPFSVGLVTGPAACIFNGASGTVGGGNVTTVVVDCNTSTFTIGGNVTGLDGTVKLKNVTTSETIAVTSNGSYAFASPEAVGSSYNILVSAQPVNQTCTVANSSGTANGNVVNVNVTCQ